LPHPKRATGNWQPETSAKRRIFQVRVSWFRAFSYLCRLKIKHNMKNYETVFILNPVLSEDQAKDAVEKFVKVLKKANAEILNNEQWGLKKLAYPINKKSTGFYNLIEFAAPTTVIDTLETEYRRDESVMRFLTTALDKHATVYNERRRKGEFRNKENRKPKKAEEGASK
jgi:small subunit ribosomal protein S6